jgi:hypothetical protein
MAKESIMGIKITKAASVKRKLPVKKPTKTAVKRVSNVKKPTGRVDEIGPAILALTDRMNAMTASMVASTAKTDAAILSMTDRMAASKAETDAAILSMTARMEKNSADIVKIIDAMKQDQKETNLALRRTTEDLSEKLDKTIREMRETTRELSESIHDIDGNVGGINRRLGKIVEMVVLPGLMEKMNTEYSHRFDNVAPNKKFTADGQMYAEMDLFLENGDSVMAVEAKTRLTLGMVNAFVQKLETLRQHEVSAGLVGKTIYAAMAGIIFDDNAKKVALEKGIYLVGIDQNNEKIKIETPTRPAGKW